MGSPQLKQGAERTWEWSGGVRGSTPGGWGPSRRLRGAVAAKSRVPLQGDLGGSSRPGLRGGYRSTEATLNQPREWLDFHTPTVPSAAGDAEPDAQAPPLSRYCFSHFPGDLRVPHKVNMHLAQGLLFFQSSPKGLFPIDLFRESEGEGGQRGRGGERET